MALIGEALGDNRFASNRLWQKRKKTKEEMDNLNKLV